MEKIQIPNLSTGDPSTLGSYLRLCTAFFGSDAGPTRFIQAEINRSKNGANEEVIADEHQMLFMLGQMLTGKVDADQAIEARKNLS